MSNITLFPNHNPTVRRKSNAKSGPNSVPPPHHHHHESSTRFSLTRKLSFLRSASSSALSVSSTPAPSQEEDEEEVVEVEKTATTTSPPQSLLQRRLSNLNLSALAVSSSPSKRPSSLPIAPGAISPPRQHQQEDAPPPPPVVEHTSRLRRRSSSAFALLFPPNAAARNNASSNPNSPLLSRSSLMTKDMERLNALILTKRKLLVNELVASQGDLAIKIRFVDAVNQFRAESEGERQVKMGRTICSLFVSGADMFKIHTFSPETTALLGRERLDALHTARLEILRELSQDAAVLRAMCLVEKHPL